MLPHLTPHSTSLLFLPDIPIRVPSGTLNSVCMVFSFPPKLNFLHNVFLSMVPKFSTSRWVASTLSFLLSFSIEPFSKLHLFCLWDFLSHVFFISASISLDEGIITAKLTFPSPWFLSVHCFLLLIIPTPPAPPSRLQSLQQLPVSKESLPCTFFSPNCLISIWFSSSPFNLLNSSTHHSWSQ